MWNEKKSSEPKILYCGYGDKEAIYKRIQEEEDLFRDADLKHIFLLAMAVGFKEGVRKKIEKRDPGGLIRTDSLNEKEKDLIKAISIASTGKIDILLDKREPYNLAEEYANGGIKILEREILNEPIGSYHKRLASKLIENLKKIENDGRNSSEYE